MIIVLIGPVFPYKGGIAHYTSLLCRALREEHQVEMISYSMQYPRLLFKKEQKDYSNRSFEIEDAKYWINTANPLNWIKVAGQIKALKPDAVLIEWWHPYFAPCYFILARLLRKYTKAFLCHNVFPHERFPLDRFLTKLTLRQGDKFIVQSNMDRTDLLSIIPNAPCIVTPHPTYNAFKMSNLSRMEAREKLGMSETQPMLLFFGFVREYKGLKYLLKAMPDILRRFPEGKLWVVGDFDKDKSEYLQLIEQKQLKENVVIVDGYIPDHEVEKYFAATDLVVLPYTSATQSGIAQIAFGFEKPVIATNVGGLPDVIEDGRTGYIVEKENEKALADAVIRFFMEDNSTKFVKNIKDKEAIFSWKTLAKKIEKLVTDDEETKC